MKKYRKVIALLLALATVSDAVPVITSPVTVEAATAVKLSRTKLTMGLGDSYTLKLTGAKSPVWKSSNSKIAIVKNGKVIARKAGKVTISATYKGKSYKCTVLVKSPKISSAKFSMTVGTKKQVKVLNTINRVTWVSSNKAVATVDRNGLVTARKAGTVKIVGKLHGKRYTSVITVKKSAAKPVALSKKSATVLVGGSLQLKLNNAVSSKVVWKTSNKAIATVSKGKVIPKKSGKVTITAVYNKKSYKCTVVVPQPAISSSDGYALAVGKSLTLKTTNTKGTVTWKSSDTSVATISSLGKVTAKKAGKTTISAVIGGYTIKKTIEVVDNDNYISETFELVPGEYLELPEGTVTSYTKGLVSINGTSAQMLKPGTAKVTVKNKKGIIYDYEFVIKKSYLNQTELQLGVGFSDLLDLLDNELLVEWSSSNSAIATVNEDGFVTGKKKGTAIITGLAGGVKYTCKVTVTGGSSNSGDNGNNGSNNSNGSNNGNNGSNGSNGSNSGNNGSSTGGNTGSNTGNNGSNGSNSGNTGNNGNTSNGSNSGSNGSTGGNTTNKPSTVPQDPEAEIKRYDWNKIKGSNQNDLGQLIHGNKMQLIIDNAPDASFSLGSYGSDLISIDKNGVITTTADVTKAGDEAKVGVAEVYVKSGKDSAKFWFEVKRAEFSKPNKTIYTFVHYDNVTDTVEAPNQNIPQEAKRDIFNYYIGQNYSKVNAKFEVLYGHHSRYLDFGNYAVDYDILKYAEDENVVFESADRMDAVFGWLKNKPDYVKAREVARWMTSHITYGKYSDDGTFLGIRSGVCADSASFFYRVMWYLGIECIQVGSGELNHEWNMVKLDGYWYGVDVTAGVEGWDGYYAYGTLYGSATSDADDFYGKQYNYLLNKGYFNTRPYGTKYFNGCKVLVYNSVDELKADCINKSSKLWQEFNENGGVAVNVPGEIDSNIYSLLPGEMGGSGYQNPLAEVANGNDKSRITYARHAKSILMKDTTSLSSLSNYLN